MQTTKATFGRGASLIAICALLFSFSRPLGGDSFEIYLNKKLVIQQFVHNDKSTKTFALHAADQDKQLEVRYSHCGQAGKGRTLTIRDGQDRVLNKWNFPDAASAKTGMAVGVKAIGGRIKDRENKVHLYYTSKEIPEGKLLASIVFTNDQSVVYGTNK